MDRTPPIWALGVLLLATLAVGCARPEGEARAPRIYETCASCHGDDGEGNREYGAPAIAGMPQWYLQRQLEKFRDGHRGVDPDDYQGLRMRAMVRTLDPVARVEEPRELAEGEAPPPSNIEAIAAYVSAMPAATPQPTDDPLYTGASAERGQGLYATCVECHGENAQGNEERDAPPLTMLNDWYIVAQLSKFKAGDRGTTPGDETGAAMRPMALGLASEQAMADVAAYIATLGGQ